jgi:putative exosortase-associated protein (TIGR04073 family)
MIKHLHILSLSLLLAVSSNCLANNEYSSQVKEKALSGLTNMVTGPLEIPKNVINTTNQSNVVFGAVGGLLKGILHGMARIMSGFSDLVTAPLPTKPTVHPARIWDDFDADTEYSDKFRLAE